MIEEAIAKWQKTSLSDYCLNTCETVCCSHGFPVEPESVPFMEKGGMKLEEIKTSTGIEYRKPGGMMCSYYDSETRTCQEHENEFRPKVCQNSPLYLNETLIKSGLLLLQDSCEIALKQDESPMAELSEICEEHGFLLKVLPENVVLYSLATYNTLIWK